MEKNKQEPLEPIITKIPLPASDSAMVIDLPDGQKLVVGKMNHGTVIEVATWRGTGRPDSRTNRMMLGLSSSEAEAEEKIRRETENKDSKSVSNLQKSVVIAQKVLVWLFVPKKSNEHNEDQGFQTETKKLRRISLRSNSFNLKKYIGKVTKLPKVKKPENSTFSSDLEFEEILASIERKARLSSQKKSSSESSVSKKRKINTKTPSKKTSLTKKTR